MKSCPPDDAGLSDKAKITIRLMDVKDEMERLMDEAMNEDKFWGMMALDDTVAFDYGRDILKEGTFETTMRLPYKRWPLFIQ